MIYPLIALMCVTRTRRHVQTLLVLLVKLEQIRLGPTWCVVITATRCTGSNVASRPLNLPISALPSPLSLYPALRQCQAPPYPRPQPPPITSSPLSAPSVTWRRARLSTCWSGESHLRAYLAPSESSKHSFLWLSVWWRRAAVWNALRGPSSAASSLGNACRLLLGCRSKSLSTPSRSGKQRQFHCSTSHILT